MTDRLIEEHKRKARDVAQRFADRLTPKVLPRRYDSGEQPASFYCRGHADRALFLEGVRDCLTSMVSKAEAEEFIEHHDIMQRKVEHTHDDVSGGLRGQEPITLMRIKRLEKQWVEVSV